jgi:hypothetical protein
VSLNSTPEIRKAPFKSEIAIVGVFLILTLVKERGSAFKEEITLPEIVICPIE